MERLESCPFCGAPAKIKPKSYRGATPVEYKIVANHHPKCIFSELIWIGGYRSEVEACEAWNWRYDYA